MTDWIEINLPWSYVTKTYCPIMPDFDDKIREEFGTTAQTEKSKITRQDFDRYGTTLSEFNRKIETTRDLSKISNPEYMELIAEEYKNVPAVQKVVAYHQLKNKIELWKTQQPEYVAWEETYKEWKRNEEQKSFCGRKLNLPGTLVEIQDGKEVMQYLIGDINKHAGVCDDCTAFEPDAIVLRYKIVWTVS